MNMSFLNIMLCYYFSLEAVLQDMTRNNPTKTELEAEIQVTLKNMPVLLTHRRENLKLIVTSRKDRF